MNKNLLGLNDNQQMVITNQNNKILVIAGAGSGKSLVIVRKIAQLIDERINANRIYCISFTRAAANELSKRVCKYHRKRGKDVNISTFHMFIINLMRKHMNLNFNIIDENEKSILINNVVQRFKIKSATKFQEALKKSVKSENRTLQYAIDEYLFMLNKLNLMDIDVILPLFLDKLSNTDFLKSIQDDIEYLIYDEAQDMNFLQYSIINKIISPSSDKGLMLVGDDDQNIYSWNGTDVKYILDFKTTYNASLCCLNINYRCSNQIVELSNKLIAQNTNRIDKKIEGIRDSKDIEIVPFNSVEDEYMRLIGIALQYQHSKDETIAILCRTNQEISDLKYLFEKYNIDCATSNKDSVNNNVLNLLRFIINPQNDLLCESILNISKEIKFKANESNRSYFDTALELMNDTYSEKIASLNTKIKNLTALESYKSICKVLKVHDLRLEKLLESYTDTKRNSDSLEQFINFVQLLDRQDILKAQNKAVNILTIHCSKGLEFNHVCVANVTEISFDGYSKEVEDTRRLLYVALTRAKDNLTIMYPKAQKTIYKGIQPTQLSSIIKGGMNNDY